MLKSICKTILHRWLGWRIEVTEQTPDKCIICVAPHTSMTDQLAQKAKESSHFSLAITPEGTRSLAKQWKRGFYFIALKAQLPILLYAIDYPNKRIVCTKTLNPSGNVDADMRIIMEYYRQFEGKHPEKFAVEEIAQ